MKRGVFWRKDWVPKTMIPLALVHTKRVLSCLPCMHQYPMCILMYKILTCVYVFPCCVMFKMLGCTAASRSALGATTTFRVARVPPPAATAQRSAEAFRASACPPVIYAIDAFQAPDACQAPATPF